LRITGAYSASRRPRPQLGPGPRSPRWRITRGCRPWPPLNITMFARDNRTVPVFPLQSSFRTSKH